MRGRLLTLVVILGISGCGDSNGDRGPDLGPTATVTRVSITPGTDMIKINEVTTFSLTATMSDGNTRSMAGAWTSDVPSVATVEPSGRVTARASGEATITAEAQGMRDTRRLRVVPDYQGRWTGDWAVAGCSTTGDWERLEFCREIPTGSLSSFQLVLTQNRDTVTGTVDLDELPGPVNGSIGTDGRLTLNGSFTVTEEGIVIEVTVSDWQTVTTDNQRMTGRFGLTFRAAGVQGSVRFEGELRVVAKTGGTLRASTGGASSPLRRALILFGRR